MKSYASLKPEIRVISFATLSALSIELPGSHSRGNTISLNSSWDLFTPQEMRDLTIFFTPPKTNIT